MMKFVVLLFALAALTNTVNGFLGLSHKKSTTGNTTENLINANVKIYSNLAEIILPLSKLPLEFSEEDWKDIREDSVTLVGTNVTITQQTITEKKKPLDNTQVYVRSPSSSNTETKFIKATLIDEKRNLVKLIDKDISKEPVFLTVSSHDIIHESDPPQSKFYVNFVYDTTDAVYVSYLRSNLNWKTRYQLYLFDDSKSPVLISMADIRNDGQSKVDIEHAELLGGDINLQMRQQSRWAEYPQQRELAMAGASGSMHDTSGMSFVPTISQAQEIAGLYVFGINKPFSIDAKTNYLLPMFRARVTIERYASISKQFHHAGSSTGKAQRSYHLVSDRYLTRGNCVIRENDRLVGETTLPDLAAKNKHDFSVGEDADIIYRENVTLISSRTYEATTRAYGESQSRTQSTYDVVLFLKNYKNRPIQIEFQQLVYGTSVKLLGIYTNFTQEGSTIKYKTILLADDEKVVSYKLEIVN